ncbi:hypothetical protein DFJ77DRAFT_355323 [Powellomyces hirtus]|nr:hypothetical protein DFJ77DRAFT_355323 [Powellomyces hirtus]
MILAAALTAVSIAALIDTVLCAPTPSSLRPLTGLADIHVHQMAEFAYRRAWYAKGKGGTVSHKGPIEQALHKCNGGIPFSGRESDHAGTIFPIIDTLIAPDAGLHLKSRYGVDPDAAKCHSSNPNWWRGGNATADGQRRCDKTDKSFRGFPSWDTLAHQQVWEGHLKQAHESGLNVMVMTAVNYKRLCKLMRESATDSDPTLSCDGMASIKRQFDETKTFCRERDWCVVVTDPSQARQVVNEGRLAVLLAIELGHVFEDSDVPWSEQVDYWYNEGARIIQIAHEEDNKFAGVVKMSFIFKFFQALESIGKGDPSMLPREDSQGRNMKGLTAEGAKLIQKLMDKGFIIDMAHLSARSIEAVMLIAKNNQYYPTLSTHGNFVGGSYPDPAKAPEWAIPSWEALYIRRSGGMVGIHNWGKAPDASLFLDYNYATSKLGLQVAYGSDWNGFATTMQPSPDFEDETLRQNGAAHIGVLGAIQRELEKRSPDQGKTMLQSAENFVQVWERSAYKSKRTGPLSVDGFQPFDVGSKSPSGIFTGDSTSK